MNLYKKRVYSRVTTPFTFTSNHCWLKFRIPIIMISFYNRLKKWAIFELLLREWGNKALYYIYNTQFYASIDIL